MKDFGHFLRTTLVDGILFPVPIIVLIIVLSKALAIAHKLVDPIAARLSDSRGAKRQAIRDDNRMKLVATIGQAPCWHLLVPPSQLQRRSAAH